VSAPPRFHVPRAAPGARVDLPEHSAHHAREVLRLRAAAAVRVFDGEGHEFEAVLDEVSRRTVSARLGRPAAPRPESPLRLVLAVSPLKGDRMELVVQKATELGVSGIWPVVTFRTDAAARPALHGSRTERWERVASGAAEQCGRAVVPHVAPTTTLDGLLERPFEGGRAVLLETPGQPPLASFPLEARSSLLLLVGPAGGFEPSEADRLRAAGFAAVSLGPRVLRAETAAVAAVAVAQALWGDLRA
jgi:16S rRNA (uracil1498-N3)-methyltransferase